MRVIIVDDDPGIRDFVTEVLGAEGIDCHPAEDAESALRMLTQDSAGYDVVLLDVHLPGRLGWELMSEIRDLGISTPVIFLTGLGGVDDRVKGLDLGADDYMQKPFEGRELVARIRSVVRRGAGVTTLVFGDLRANLDNRSVERAGVALALTPREFDVLMLLVRARGDAVERAEIFRRVWDREDDGESKSLDVVISRMKRKLDSAPPFRIHSVVAMDEQSRRELVVAYRIEERKGPAEGSDSREVG